ncbi:PREDICTED: dentin sialophosphoprotein-like [Crocodylus porosus]|uniref:dentin sialophosphoprotein-like n=1 Tax=Crocodylus porosus TaxID=8502 RepID=UPI00093AA8FE|nr:PREDICTED: dentin sialophosphoprotein-like [Crocodylus porosus]
MNILLLMIHVLGIISASPIKRSANLPGSEYEASIASFNVIDTDKEVLSNSSENDVGNKQNGENRNYGHLEETKLINFTSGLDQTEEVSTIDSNIQGTHKDKSNNQLNQEDTSLQKSNDAAENNIQQTQSVDDNVELQRGKGINSPYIDPHVSRNGTEQNHSEQLNWKNVGHDSALEEEEFVPQETVFSSEKQDMVKPHITSHFNTERQDNEIHKGHLHFDTYYFSHEAMQEEDAGNGSDGNEAISSQQEENNSDSVQSAQQNGQDMASDVKSSSESSQDDTNELSAPSSSSDSTDSSHSSNSSDPRDPSNSKKSGETGSTLP